MNITHSFFNNFDKHANYFIEKNYIFKNSKKIMKILNIPIKDCNVTLEKTKTNNIFNSKIILDFNNLNKVTNKELVRKYLNKSNTMK